MARRSGFRALGFWVLISLLIVAAFIRGFALLLHPHHGRELPPLARGIPFGAASPLPNPEWTLRLKARFPPGSEVHAMTEELDSEDFTVDAKAHRASFKWGRGWPCLEILEVDWTENAEARIASIEGFHYSACL